MTGTPVIKDFISPENIRKPEVFWCFMDFWKGALAQNGLITCKCWFLVRCCWFLSTLNLNYNINYHSCIAKVTINPCQCSIYAPLKKPETVSHYFYGVLEKRLGLNFCLLSFYLIFFLLQKWSFFSQIFLLLKQFFSIWVFLQDHSRITGLPGEGDSISSLPIPLSSQTLRVSRTMTTKCSPLHIGSSRAWTGNLWFPSATR